MNHSQRKLTLAELCDRYSKTVQHHKERTVKRKTFIIEQIKSDWPTGKLTQIGKIKPSDCDLWLSSIARRARRFGSASHDLHISCIKELFDLAVRDRIITASPAAHLRSAKRERDLKVGDRAPDALLVSLNGRSRQSLLQAMNGKPTVLVFGSFT